MWVISDMLSSVRWADFSYPSGKHGATCSMTCISAQLSRLCRCTLTLRNYSLCLQLEKKSKQAALLQADFKKRVSPRDNRLINLTEGLCSLRCSSDCISVLSSVFLSVSAALSVAAAFAKKDKYRGQGLLTRLLYTHSHVYVCMQTRINKMYTHLQPQPMCYWCPWSFPLHFPSCGS